jgi:hypothetical protein
MLHDKYSVVENLKDAGFSEAQATALTCCH